MPSRSKRVRADHFPAVALADPLAFVFVDRTRGALQERLDVGAGGGRGVEKQHAAGFAAGVLPGMRDVAREERAGAGTADADLLADLEGDLALEHPSDLVAVAVKMEGAHGAGGHGFLEQHEALTGAAARRLSGAGTARGPPAQDRPAAAG